MVLDTAKGYICVEKRDLGLRCVKCDMDLYPSAYDVLCPNCLHWGRLRFVENDEDEKTREKVIDYAQFLARELV